MKKRPPVSFVFFVIIPVITAVVYYLFYASSQYVVETKYVIQSNAPTQVDMLGALAGIAGTSSPSSQGSYIVQEYILSAELLKKLDVKLKIKSHYSSDQYDWWARLQKQVSLSDFLEYWKSVVEIEYDTTTGISGLSVTAFSDVMAFDIAKELLKEGEQQINHLTKRSRKDMLSFAKTELALAENKLVEARAAITSFRSEKSDIDPEKTTQAKLEIVAELEGQLSNAEAELSNTLKSMKSGSMKVRSLRNKVSSLKQQVYTERKRWSNSKEANDSLNERIAKYEKLLAIKAVTEKLYESSLISLETARLNAIQQQQYLEVIVAPYKPTEAEKPYVINNVLSVILGSFLFWTIGTLIISAIKDH